MSYKGVSVVQIVATDLNCAIGKNGQLPWHIPEDLKHFKETTTDGIVVMGRKTYDSIGRPLPNRSNWVVSKTGLNIPGVKVCRNISEVLGKAADEALSKGKDHIYIVGGGEVYKDTLFCTDRILLTQVMCRIAGDTFYFDPALMFRTTSIGDWEKSVSGPDFRLIQYSRIR